MTFARSTVRRAVLGDEPILRTLRLEALAEAPEAFGSTYEREMARTTADWQRWLAPGATFILEDESSARGLVAGMLDAQEPGIVHLMAMWVDPALRGSGAAGALVAEHLAWARTVGAKLVHLDVFATNSRARRLYERHGFRITGQETVRDDGRLELRMELALGATASPRIIHGAKGHSDALVGQSLVKSLEKHASILEALRELASSLGQHAFVVVDHWEADDHAVGVASPHDSSRLVYIASRDGTPGLYDAELEFPPSAGSDLPYTPGPSHAGLELTDLVRLVSEHLRGSK